MKENILKNLESSITLKNVIESFSKQRQHFLFSGLKDSGLSFCLSHLFRKSKKNFLIILESKEQAVYLFNDLQEILGKDIPLFYPNSYKNSYQKEETDNANVLLRSKVLQSLNTHKNSKIVISFPDAISEKVLTQEDVKKHTLTLQKNENISLDFFNEMLFEQGFHRVDFVSESGEFSVRGSIIDVFSFANDKPFRIEFFDDEVSRIRYFDVETQLTTTEIDTISIVSNIQKMTTKNHRVTLLKNFGKNTIVCLKNHTHIFEKIEDIFEKSKITFENSKDKISHLNPEEFLANTEEILEDLHFFSRIDVGSFSKNETAKQIIFQQKPQPPFHKQFDLLLENLKTNQEKNIINYICCSNEKQVERLRDIFESLQQKQQYDLQYKAFVMPIQGGFIDLENSIACYTDHQIFERYHKFKLNRPKNSQKSFLESLNNLQIGDYVTHIDHGVGKFGGLQKIEVNGGKQEAIKLVYDGGDILYVSIHSLYKITKFNGKDGKPPRVFKLGSGAWKKLKQKTKKSVKKIAFDLIKLYAKRKLKQGFSFDRDSYLQHELEASFMYEDTPDQYTATQEVKKDMESPMPMDRLICGDVGFGKTEIAIRAAFKAVDNNKQVVILVPTTILAFQHYKTFKNRLKDFPVEVNYLNRFRTPKEKTEILKKLAGGKIDIIIGTHQLTNKNIRFKDLGLLIIDEEQKFGVAVKDKLKNLKTNIDTLTLTATPIPRTLQFSLMAARDLSVIRTPPPNRYPIDTKVIRFNEAQITEAILYELSRGGQVFFVHNRVENIKEISGILQRFLPNAKIGIGHGQMEGKKLEDLILSFMEGAYDVLISTTIIENGLDVPNANTIFINNAQNFGLSDLHQMRGRVGRSNKNAFCYLITPAFHTISSEAQKRIKAIELFSDLGSGIHIAMKDLEIRGAGDLLGGDQSGFMNEMGFDTYQQILQESVKELKQNEFKHLYQEKEDIGHFVKEVQLSTDFEILFPDDYINSIEERLTLYKKLGKLKHEKALQKFKNQLIDRFGALPVQVKDLLDSVRIKWFTKQIGIEKIILKNQRMTAYFIADQQSNYYESQAFTKVLNFVQNHKKDCVLKEKVTKNGMRLLLTFIKIKSVQKALQTLEKMTL